MILPKENGCQREKTWLKADLKKNWKNLDSTPQKQDRYWDRKAEYGQN